MSTTSAADAVEQVLKPIQQFTRGWMMTPDTSARGVALGLRSGNDFWIIGRAGVMGDVNAATAASGLAFISPQGVAAAWAALPGGLTPSQVGTHYAACCTDWGRDALAVFDPARLELIDRLGRRIIDAAPASLGALFAGWRAVPQPAGVGERVALTTHVMREMRGAAHIVAVLASGITPLDAVLASPAAPPRSGPGWAEHLHWHGPFRDPEEVREARIAAERLTSQIMCSYFAVLSADELATFAEVVETTRNAIDM